MNPHPASFALDIFALAITLAVGAALCWLATLVWFYFALRADRKREREASKRIISTIRESVVRIVAGPPSPPR